VEIRPGLPTQSKTIADIKVKILLYSIMSAIYDANLFEKSWPETLIEAMKPSDSACNELDSLESLDACLALGRGFCLLALRSILLVV